MSAWTCPTWAAGKQHVTVAGPATPPECYCGELMVEIPVGAADAAVRAADLERAAAVAWLQREAEQGAAFRASAALWFADRIQSKEHLT